MVSVVRSNACCQLAGSVVESVAFSAAGVAWRVRSTEDNDCTRERCGIGVSTKLESSAQTSDLAAYRDGAATRGFLPSLPHPLADSSAVGWVHPADARPRLIECVVIAGEEHFALGVAGRILWWYACSALGELSMWFQPGPPRPLATHKGSSSGGWSRWSRLEQENYV